MSNSSDLGVDPPDDEFLVAYLDGQLADEQAEAIEARLASDSSMRERLQSLDRVWNALDALPRSTASAAFTRSTVEMAAVAEDQGGQGGDARRWLNALPYGVLASVTGIAAGLLISLFVSGLPERRAMRDLPVALHAEALENAASIAFLRELHNGYSDRLNAINGDQVAAAGRWTEVSSADFSERREWIASLSKEQLSEVSADLQAYRARLPNDQSELRQLEIQIAGAGDSAGLRQAALAYQNLVGRLSSGEQARLRELSDIERIAEVDRSLRRWSRTRVLEMKDAERATLREAVDLLVESDDFEQTIQSIRERSPFRRVQLDGRRQLLFLCRLIANIPDDRQRGARRPESANPPMFTELREAWITWTAMLESALPERIERLMRAESSVSNRARLWERLFTDAMQEDLVDSFASLSNDEMQEVLLLPDEEFVRAVTDDLGEQQGPPGFDPRRGPPDFERSRPPRQRGFERFPGRPNGPPSR